MYFLSVNHLKEDADGVRIGEVIPLHIEWTRRLIAEGKVAQAGKWGEAGGMAILRADGLEEAEAILRGDPLIAAGLVDHETAELFQDVAMD